MIALDELEQGRTRVRMVAAHPFNAEAEPDALRSDITPNGAHYIRSNFAVPRPDGTLRIGGAVAHPTVLTLDDLRAMPAVERAVTLECAGNGRLGMRPLPIGEPWGAYAVSTARWKGALLHQVLAAAQPSADGVEVRFEGADHGAYHLKSVLDEAPADLSFVRSLSLAQAVDPGAEVLIAYEMNGEPLPPDHGAPFRLIVPHWYAVASVKWLTAIDVLTEPFVGEFQTGHYIYEWTDQPHEPVTLLRVRARLTDPLSGATLPAGRQTLRGKAWSGSGSITRVELSFTGDGEWFPAELAAPAEPYAWQSWSLDWDATPGRHSIRVRATDAAGNVQPEVPPWNRLGYGNNSVEVSYVEVEPA